MKTAIVPIDPEGRRDWMTLVSQTIAKSARLSEQELIMFATISEHLGLDVWRKEIYAIRYGSNNPVSFVLGIDAYLRKAAETGLYDGQDPILYAGKDGEWTELWVSDDPPYAAKATVYRKGSSHGITYIARYNSAKRDSSLWKSQPDIQLGINALKHALRRGFGDAFGDLDQQVIRLRSEGMRVVDEDTGEILDALPEAPALEQGDSESAGTPNTQPSSAVRPPQPQSRSQERRFEAQGVGSDASTRFWPIAKKRGSAWWEPLLAANFNATDFALLSPEQQLAAAELVEAEDAK